MMQATFGERISLFVVHWNQPQECAATVQALLGQGVQLKSTIIDNNSAAAAYEELRGRVGPDVEIVRLPQNKGWGPALNVVLRNWLETQRDPFCLISAHDAAPAPDCLKLLINACKIDSKIGISCPQYPEATIPGFSAVRAVHENAGVPLERGAAQSVDVPHGTLMLVRRECLAQIGLFDERYFAYGDEHELGARGVRQGWKVALVWGALVTNPETSTPSVWRSYLCARNSLLLVHDYYGSLAAWTRAVLMLANTTRLIFFSRGGGVAFSAKARFKAVRDYFRGRYGPPVFE